MDFLGAGVEETRSGSINIYRPSSGRGELSGVWALRPERLEAPRRVGVSGKSVSKRGGVRGCHKL